MTVLHQKNQSDTTHNRVLVETSKEASELAKRWNCTKIEVYRWLVKMAIDGKIEPPLGDEKGTNQ